MASLRASPPSQDGRLQVLELGVGIGLFARFFLDRFRELCIEHEQDWYDRLLYVASDYSEKILVDVARSGVLAEHPGRYCLRVIDAIEPEGREDRGREAMEEASRSSQPSAGGSYRGVFLNYLLDCLPAAVLDFREEQVKELCVRTCLARGVNLADHTGLTVEDLAARAASDDPAAREELLELADLFTAEYEFRVIDRQNREDVDARSLPYGDFIAEFGAKHAGYVVHNHGATQSLERLLPLLDESGFILINDYGSPDPQQSEDVFEHQRYSGSTFVGVNFALLKEYFAGNDVYDWVEPTEESPSICSRLLCRAGSELEQNSLRPRSEEPEAIANGSNGVVVAAFRKSFGKEAAEALNRPLEAARQLVQAGRTEAAITAYRDALTRQPYNSRVKASVRYSSSTTGCPPRMIGLFAS